MVWADNVECMPRALERRNTVERYLAMSIETELVAMRKENAVLRILNTLYVMTQGTYLRREREEVIVSQEGETMLRVPVWRERY